MKIDTMTPDPFAQLTSSFVSRVELSFCTTCKRFMTIAEVEHFEKYGGCNSPLVK